MPGLLQERAGLADGVADRGPADLEQVGEDVHRGQSALVEDGHKDAFVARLAVALAGLLPAAALVAPPAYATDYVGVATSQFSCWTATSGNQYCAHITSSIADDTVLEIAYRVHIWCTVNGNPANCTITWGGGLKRYREDLGPGYATYPWGTVTKQTGGGSSEVIWQGAWHSVNTSPEYVYQTVGSVNVIWTAPSKLSGTKTRCSDAMLLQDASVWYTWSEVWAGPLNCM